MAVKLEPRHVEAIEKVLKQRGSPKVMIEVDNGKPLISEIKEEKITG